jgi:acyl carrier protein
MADIEFDARIVPMVYDVLNRDPESYADPLSQRMIADLDGDSLDMVELVMLAEDEFGIEITDEEGERFAGDAGDEGAMTVRDFCELVQPKIDAKAGA